MDKKTKKKLLFEKIGVITESDKQKFRYWEKNDNNPILQNLIEVGLNAMECQDTIDRIKKVKGLEDGKN